MLSFIPRLFRYHPTYAGSPPLLDDYCFLMAFIYLRNDSFTCNLRSRARCDTHLRKHWGVYIFLHCSEEVEDSEFIDSLSHTDQLTTDNRLH